MTKTPTKSSWFRRVRCWMDWHDYPDGTQVRTPWHFYTYICRHCGKKFRI